MNNMNTLFYKAFFPRFYEQRSEQSMNKDTHSSRLREWLNKLLGHSPISKPKRRPSRT
jgi:hypothetical protein